MLTGVNRLYCCYRPVSCVAPNFHWKDDDADHRHAVSHYPERSGNFPRVADGAVVVFAVVG